MGGFTSDRLVADQGPRREGDVRLGGLGRGLCGTDGLSAHAGVGVEHLEFGGVEDVLDDEAASGHAP
ncbi:hypothetical protein GCM10023205_04360 [Yinghuangia aomiensis]|uniref:Uncharacterized protein n=1 Tax=Yinghuangia aomiensis TaxID=676205 RepID=A0ABP9GM60_9ACTN